MNTLYSVITSAAAAGPKSRSVLAPIMLAVLSLSALPSTALAQSESANRANTLEINMKRFGPNQPTRWDGRLSFLTADNKKCRIDVFYHRVADEMNIVLSLKDDGNKPKLTSAKVFADITTALECTTYKGKGPDLASAVKDLEKKMQNLVGESLTIAVTVDDSDAARFDMQYISNQALIDALASQKERRKDPITGVTAVKDQFGSSTIGQWANAIHLAWISTITLEELENALGAIGTFKSKDIKKAADVYFLEIVIHVDTKSILARRYSSNSPAPVDAYVKFTSNHKSVTSGQGTNELDAEGLQPNESISWKALSSSNKRDTIQLVKFHPSPINPNVDFSQMIAAPKRLKGHSKNEYFTHVKSHPKRGLRYAYSFDFTINGDPQQFTFDPWLGD